jgi:ATP-dependent DNA helicase RecQ
LAQPPTIALTATATDNVRRDICEQLELKDPRVFITGFDRPNLRYEVRHTFSDSAKQEALSEVFKKRDGAGIIYCSSRKRCEEVSGFLRRDLKRKALVYHAGLSPDERRRAQDAFMNGRDLIVVATNAFGMGVDKPDIRFVIHYNIPGTVEAYYQEAGRAGRDGADSLCLTLYAPGDRYIQEFFIESEYPSREVIAAIYDFLSRQPENPIEMTQEQIKERLRLEISEMGVGQSLKLLESAGVLERLRPRENMAIVRIDSEVSLVGLLPQNAANQRRVLSALERLVAATHGDDTYFSPHQLGQRLELDPPQFSRAMAELCQKLPIDYVPPFRGNAVRMIDRDKTMRTIGIDFDQLDERKKREFDKLDQMIAYAQSRVCRRRTILHYFGDDSPAQCGHCDNCNPKGTSSRTEIATNDRVREIVRKILSGVARAARGRAGFGKRLIAAMLVGKNIKAVKKWGLDKLSTFGLLSEFDEDEVVLLIESLLATGWIEQEELDRFKPVIRLSAAGREVMTGDRDASCAWRVPAQLLAKLQGDAGKPTKRAAKRSGPIDSKAPAEIDSETLAEEALPPPELDKPIDRELFKKLKSARNRWAMEENLPAYMILPNRSLEGLARTKPESIDGLLSIKGIGSAKIAKYGERILELIGGAAGAERAPTMRSPGTHQPDPIPSHTREASDWSRRTVSEGSVSVRAAHYWTWRLLERGFTQSECALIRNMDEATVLRHAIESAREGNASPLNAFLPDELIQDLEKIVQAHSDQEIESFSDSLPDGITAEHVELYMQNRRVRSAPKP